MAYVGETPWHRLGKTVPGSVTAEELCRAAGLNWSVSKQPAPGARVINEKKKLYDRYLVVRDPVRGERSQVALGLVTGAYELLQNTEAFAFFSPFIESGFATFHTAGALGNGERVWALAKIDGQIAIVGDDLIDRYLLLSNVHDGSLERLVLDQQAGLRALDSRGGVTLRGYLAQALRDSVLCYSQAGPDNIKKLIVGSHHS
jgi:phage/plasmid-like protein (TIGR03299 family)